MELLALLRTYCSSVALGWVEIDKLVAAAQGNLGAPFGAKKGLVLIIARGSTNIHKRSWPCLAFH